MAHKGNRAWTVEVRESRDWTVTVREEDLDLPPGISDDATEEAVADRADTMVADRHPDAVGYDTTREAGRVHQA
jgi:hypothetical protein